jgi:molybdenum cofactor cytidylyltransferase
LPLAGEPLLRHTVRRALSSSLDDLFVVLDHRGQEVAAALGELPVHVIVNPFADRGQSTSVVAGLAALEDASPHIGAAIILLGDQPSVEPAVIDALIDAWRETSSPIVAPRYRDGFGNPVLFERGVFPELMNLKGDVGARSVVCAHQQAGSLALVPVDFTAPPDVDTVEDYEDLLQSFGEPTEAPGTSRDLEPVPREAPSPGSTGEGVGGEGLR